MRKRSWALWAPVYAVVVFGALIVTETAPDDSDLEGAAAFIMMVGWVAGIGHGLVVRREDERNDPDRQGDHRHRSLPTG